MVLHAVQCEPQARMLHALFPLSGFLSLVMQLDDAPGLEVGMVGNEGMLGLPLALGVSAMPWHVVVQGAGMALRIPARVFTALLEECPALRTAMHRYAYVLLSQTGSIAACNRFHSVSQRLSRWLLMSHDRANADTFEMTQEFLAYMLGVRRVSVTQAASALQAAHLISYHRGQIAVLDRDGLESAACHCYGHARDVYADIFFPSKKK